MKLLRYILFVIAVVSLQSGLAQRSDYQPEFTVGVKGGTSLSRVLFSPTVTQSLLLGYTGGVSVRYIEEKFFGLIAEINFTQCGWNETFEEDPYTYTHTLNYVTIPFLTHFFFGNRVVRGFVNAGPQIGLLLGDSYKSNFDIYNLPEFSQKSKVKEIYTMDIAHRFDYGITAGAGIEFRIKETHGIVLEGRYYYGLGDIFKNRKKDVFAASHSQIITVSLGYLYHF